MSDSLQIIVFTLDENRYALRLSCVERAVRMVEVTPLPKAPEIVLGVINVQGEIIPVLNIRKRFQLPEQEPRLGDQLIIARTTRRAVALVANSVSEVVFLPEEELVEPQSVLPGVEYVEGMIKCDDGMIFIHDLDTFLSLGEEQELEAAIEGNS